MKTLPEYVRPFMAELHATDLIFGIRTHPDVLEHLAWRRWARSLSNHDLNGLLFRIRVDWFDAGDNVVSVQLEEISRRLAALEQQQGQKP